MASIENPTEICIGIDEATAILVESDSALVVGISNVIVLRNNVNKTSLQNVTLLGASGLQLDVLLLVIKMRIK
ncbi:MAG: hypothetical protein MZV70_36650 [Desulfobacterales bacterium]|nr:hypothetical protein [Desulfobacterales bacterium]